MMLTLLVIIPLAGGFLAWLLGRWHPRWARWTALAFSLAGLGLTLAIWARHFLGSPAVATGKWVEQTDVSWILNWASASTWPWTASASSCSCSPSP